MLLDRFLLITGIRIVEYLHYLVQQFTHIGSIIFLITQSYIHNSIGGSLLNRFLIQEFAGIEHTQEGACPFNLFQNYIFLFVCLCHFHRFAQTQQTILTCKCRIWNQLNVCFQCTIQISGRRSIFTDSIQFVGSLNTFPVQQRFESSIASSARSLMETVYDSSQRIFLTGCRQNDIIQIFLALASLKHTAGDRFFLFRRRHGRNSRDNSLLDRSNGRCIRCFQHTAQINQVAFRHNIFQRCISSFFHFRWTGLDQFEHCSQVSSRFTHRQQLSTGNLTGIRSRRNGTGNSLVDITIECSQSILSQQDYIFIVAGQQFSKHRYHLFVTDLHQCPYGCLFYVEVAVFQLSQQHLHGSQVKTEFQTLDHIMFWRAFGFAADPVDNIDFHFRFCLLHRFHDFDINFLIGKVGSKIQCSIPIFLIAILQSGKQQFGTVFFLQWQKNLQSSVAGLRLISLGSLLQQVVGRFFHFFHIALCGNTFQ